MKLENQVCSLELSKKLKELGVKQESLFYWFHFPLDNHWEILPPKEIRNGDVHPRERHDCNSAFTVAELGKMLPIGCESFKGRYDGFWYCNYYPRTADEKPSAGQHGETEADARAKMLIYLIENNLIKID